MRDILVTEYGLADFCGQTNEEVIKRMIAIADSRYQNDFLEQARDAGKIALGLACAGGAQVEYTQTADGLVAPVSGRPAARFSFRNRFRQHRASLDPRSFPSWRCRPRQETTAGSDLGVPHASTPLTGRRCNAPDGVCTRLSPDRTPAGPRLARRTQARGPGLVDLPIPCSVSLSIRMSLTLLTRSIYGRRHNSEGFTRIQLCE